MISMGKEVYTVKYAFCEDSNVYKKQFNNFFDAMKFQEEILKQYKNSRKKRLQYCVYE